MKNEYVDGYRDGLVFAVEKLVNRDKESDPDLEKTVNELFAEYHLVTQIQRAPIIRKGKKK